MSWAPAKHCFRREPWQHWGPQNRESVSRMGKFALFNMERKEERKCSKSLCRMFCRAASGSVQVWKRVSDPGTGPENSAAIARGSSMEDPQQTSVARPKVHLKNYSPVPGIQCRSLFRGINRRHGCSTDPSEISSTSSQLDTNNSSGAGRSSFGNPVPREERAAMAACAVSLKAPSHILIRVAIWCLTSKE